MALGHQNDAQPVSATRSKALVNIASKACPHGAGQAAYCWTCLQDEERVVSLEDSEPRFHALWAHDRIEEKRCGVPNSGPSRAMRRFAGGTEC